MNFSRESRFEWAYAEDAYYRNRNVRTAAKAALFTVGATIWRIVAVYVIAWGLRFAHRSGSRLRFAAFCTYMMCWRNTDRLITAIRLQDRDICQSVDHKENSQ